MSASASVRPSLPRRPQAAPRAALVVVWASVAACLAGFLLPWVTLDLRGAELAALVEPPGQTRGSTSSSLDASGATSRARVLPPTAGGPRRGTESSPVGQVTLQLRRNGQALTAMLPSAAEFPRRVRGIQIPWLLRQDEAQVAVALLELLTNTRQHAALKSGAVFLVPGAALLCGVLLTAWGRRPAVAGGVLLVCVAVAAGGAWKLLTLDTSRSLIGVAIGWGLWVSLGAYVGLAASAAWTGMSGRGRT